MNLLCLCRFPAALLLVIVCVSTARAETRTWKSADGRYTVDAEFVRETSAGVSLKKSDGGIVNVPLPSLSAADRRYVERMRKVDLSPALTRNQYGETTDLLPHANVEQATKGTWSRQEAALVSGPESRTQLLVDKRMPDEYQLRMRVQMLEGSDSLIVGLPMGRGVALVIVDSSDGQWTGLDLVDGASVSHNATTFRGRAIDDNNMHEIIFTVLRGYVAMAIDGETVFRWFGQPKQLGWSEGAWTDEDFSDHRLLLGSSNTNWKIHALEVRPVLASRLDSVPIGGDSSDLSGSLALIETDGGSGSGFVAGHGLVVTNHHVIADATVGETRVYFGDENRAVPVKRVLASSKQDDLAILQVDTDCKPLPIAWDGMIPKGETVHVHGNPAIEGGVLLRGATVTGTLQSRLRMQGQDYLQIAANVNPGSSGGPVLNESGQVIGVIVMKATGEGESFLRDAARRFDTGGGVDPTVARRGVALAVPGATLNAMLEQVARVSNDQANRTSSRHDTRAVVNRCFHVAGYDFIRLLGSASRPIMMQAQSDGAGQEGSPMPPIQIWARLPALTQSESFQTKVNAMRSGIDGQLDALLQPGYGTHPDLAALRELNSQMKRLKRAADSPPSTYPKYERVLTDLSERLERLGKTLLSRDGD